MAGDPVPKVLFDGQCPDCGRRQVDLPDTLPAVGDDFDWDLGASLLQTPQPVTSHSPAVMQAPPRRAAA